MKTMVLGEVFPRKFATWQENDNLISGSLSLSEDAKGKVTVCVLLVH